MITVYFDKGGNPSNRREFTIPNEVYEYPGLVKAGDIGLAMKWMFDGNPTDIVHVRPHCGCTANIEFIGHTIIAKFAEQSNVGNTSIDAIKQGYHEVSKSLTVFFDDGKPLKVAEGANKKFNGDKAQIVISFKVKVDLSHLQKSVTPPFNKK